MRLGRNFDRITCFLVQSARLWQHRLRELQQPLIALDRSITVRFKRLKISGNFGFSIRNRWAYVESAHFRGQLVRRTASNAEI